MTSASKRIKVNQQTADSEAFRAAAKEKVEDIFANACLNCDTLILYTLHDEFGFGKDRLLRFYKALHEDHRNFMERYGIEDECHYFAMRKRLKEAGVDVEAFQEIE